MYHEPNKCMKNSPTCTDEVIEIGGVMVCRQCVASMFSAFGREEDKVEISIHIQVVKTTADKITNYNYTLSDASDPFYSRVLRELNRGYSPRVAVVDRREK